MRNRFRFLGRPVNLCVLFLAVMVAVVFSYPQAAHGRKAEPAKKDDVIDALISVNIKGTYEANRRQHTGSLTIIATGKIKNESKAIGLNQYVPEGMNATYHYEYREIVMIHFRAALRWPWRNKVPGRSRSSHSREEQP